MRVYLGGMDSASYASHCPPLAVWRLYVLDRQRYYACPPSTRAICAARKYDIDATA
jgi:hypothetical protein